MKLIYINFNQLLSTMTGENPITFPQVYYESSMIRHIIQKQLRQLK